MNNFNSQTMITQLANEYNVGGKFLAEIVPMIDEISEGDFSEHEKKYLFRLVEDAFRREAEIEQTKKAQGSFEGYPSQQNTHRHHPMHSVTLEGRMDNPHNRISPGRSPFSDFQFGEGPHSN